jgi:ribonuclease D
MSVLITDNTALAQLCEQLQQQTFITIDTEFLREKTYYPQLCLIQVGAGDGSVFAAIDPLAQGLDLETLFGILRNARIIKVFHAARQDLEILFMLMGELPSSVFDTQIAAMVCGHGEQIGYENLIGKVLGRSIDKSQQFTDWSRRPLSEAQLSYALADVIHLRDAYLKMLAQMQREERESWIEEEHAKLMDITCYVSSPEEAWLRVKHRQSKPYYLARLRTVAAWRERHARERNRPRGWILHDDALQEIAMTNPKDEAAVKAVRALKKVGVMDMDGLLAAIHEANALPKEACPQEERTEPFPESLEPARDMLRLLLKRQANEYRIAPRLIADNDMLRALLEGKRDVACLQGWRHGVFGASALDLLEGRIAMRLIDKGREVVFEV